MGHGYVVVANRGRAFPSTTTSPVLLAHLPFPSLPFPSLSFPSLPFPPLPSPSLPRLPFPCPLATHRRMTGATRLSFVRSDKGHVARPPSVGYGVTATPTPPSAPSQRRRCSDAPPNFRARSLVSMVYTSSTRSVFLRLCVKCIKFTAYFANR